jgi:hypothetical protein
MTQYNITLSAAEDKALSYTAISQQDWIDNAIHERCRVAIEEISKICIEQCLANGIQIPGSKEAMVDLAFQNGWVLTAVQRQAQIDAEMAARAQAAQTEGA